MNTLDLLADAISTLENYGDHHEWCAQRIHGRSEPDVCDCGFAIKLVVLREHRDRMPRAGRRRMSEDEVRQALDEIREAATDDERAHSLQDRLFRKVLEAIATAPTLQDARALAAEALRVDEIDFSRWMA